LKERYGNINSNLPHNVWVWCWCGGDNNNMKLDNCVKRLANCVGGNLRVWQPTQFKIIELKKHHPSIYRKVIQNKVVISDQILVVVISGGHYHAKRVKGRPCQSYCFCLFISLGPMMRQHHWYHFDRPM